jgi:hypothetical protein
VEEIARLEDESLRHLKVRAGEHLAAILTTAFLGVAPTAVDTAGGVDLLFESPVIKDLGGFFPQNASATFEVKSMPGPFRQFDGEIDHRIKHGHDASGMTLWVKVESVSDIIRSAIPVLEKISRSLNQKAPSEASRNGFLIIHPLDRLALEFTKSDLMAQHMPVPPPELDLDTVWVLWIPDSLTMWSQERGEWIELIFSAFNPDEKNDLGTLPILQEIGLTFADAVGHIGGDPYIFSLSAQSKNDDAEESGRSDDSR